MIRLFRNIRKQLAMENKAVAYMRYAIGEIVLVVIGILIALQVNNWNENQKLVKEAKIFRARLVNDISADINNIEKRVGFFEKALSYGYSAEEELNQPKAETIEDKWQFIVKIFHASQIWNFSLTTSTFNEIQNSGMLGYIGSPELSNELSLYYVDFPVQLNQLTGGTTAYRDYVRSVIPIKVQDYIWKSCYKGMDNLSSQTFNECNGGDLNPKTIEDLYQRIVNDALFKDLLTRRLSTIYVRNTVYYGTINQAKTLISNIQKVD
jgi:hypothetical protein